MKKILYIAYYFPPMNNGGTERTKQFYNRLIDDGYEVDVVCGTLNKDKPHDNITYVSTLQNNINPLISLILAAIEYLLRLFGFTVTLYTLWKKKSMKILKKRLKTTKYDLCIATYSPLEDLEIGLWIREKYNIPLISDFRDGLLFEPIEPFLRMASYRKKCKNVEIRCATLSNHIVTAAPQISQYFRNTYGVESVTTIMNGFDDDHPTNGIPLNLPRKGLVFLYTGGIDCSRLGLFDYAKNTLSFLFNTFPNDTFVFIGNYKDYEVSFFADFPNVILINQQPRDVVIATQKEADVLLAVTGNIECGTSGKLFEYLFANHPILSIGINNNGNQIIQSTKTGKSFNADELNEIEKYVREIKEKSFVLGNVNKDLYTRRYQYHQLKTIIESINKNL